MPVMFVAAAASLRMKDVACKNKNPKVCMLMCPSGGD